MTQLISKSTFIQKFQAGGGFKAAWTAARKAKKRTFSYKGKIYNTMTEAEAKTAESRKKWMAKFKDNSKSIGNSRVLASQSTGWEKEKGAYEGVWNDQTGNYEELHGQDKIKAKDATPQQKKEAIAKWKANGEKGVWQMYLPFEKWKGPRVDADTDKVTSPRQGVTVKKSPGPTRSTITVGESDPELDTDRPKTNSEVNHEVDKPLEQMTAGNFLDANGLYVANPLKYAERTGQIINGIRYNNPYAVLAASGDLAFRAAGLISAVNPWIGQKVANQVPALLQSVGTMLGMTQAQTAASPFMQATFAANNATGQSWVKNAMGKNGVYTNNQYTTAMRGMEGTKGAVTGRNFLGMATGTPNFSGAALAGQMLAPVAITYLGTKNFSEASDPSRAEWYSTKPNINYGK